MGSNNIFLFGLDRAGKTAFAQYLKHGSCNQTLPTLAFDISKWMIEKTEFTIWDAPGQKRLRSVWKNGVRNTQILMFILDVSDADRFSESKEEFDRIILDPVTKEMPLLFCFHKIDLPTARSNMQLARAVFKLSEIKNRKLATFDTSIYGCQDIELLKQTLIDFINFVHKPRPN